MRRLIVRFNRPRNSWCLLAVSLFPGFAVTADILQITSERSQIGCRTIDEYMQYHSSTYEKDGAVPQTNGCIRLDAKSHLESTGRVTVAKLAGMQVQLTLYKVKVQNREQQVWLAPSAIESATPP